MIELGRGDEFRRVGWLERAGRPLRKPLANSRLKAPLKRLYEAVLDRLPGDRLVGRLPHGEAVRLVAAYRQVGWNLEEYEAFRSVVRPGATVLDVGANLGAYTVLFAQWVGASGRVHAFEPAPGTRAGLIRHIDLNGMAERVLVHAEAMSAAEGTAQFRAVGIQGDNRLVSGADRDAISIRTTSVDDFCAASGVRPGLIKVDVEGAELGVLKGARRTILSLGASLELYVEMHPHLWADFGYSRADIQAELDHQNLRAERLDGHPDAWSIAGVCLRLRPCAS
jgi:FkbM family methyltransferase